MLITDASGAVGPWRHLGATLPTTLQPPALRAVLERRIESNYADRVRGCAGMFLAARLGHLRQRKHEPRVHYWIRQNTAFGKSVCSRSWGEADTVYGFAGAALEIFQEAHRRGVRRILDQPAAPWRFNTDLLSIEQTRWPGWETSPANLDTGGRMIAREQAEWALADIIVCGSSFVVEAIRQVGGPVEKCRVVPYPTPVVPEAGPRSSRSGRSLRVLFVGTLQLRKGIQYFSESVSHLPGNRFEFRAVGPSDLSKSAEQIVRSGIDYLGRVARADVWQHYQWADVFVLPTLSEGSANVCWEALASGATIVTTAAAGIDGAATHIVRPEAEAIAEALRECESSENTPQRLSQSRTVADYGADLLRATASATHESRSSSVYRL